MKKYNLCWLILLITSIVYAAAPTETFYQYAISKPKSDKSQLNKLKMLGIQNGLVVQHAYSSVKPSHFGAASLSGNNNFTGSNSFAYGNFSSLQTKDVITKDSKTDIRSFMDGFSGRPTVAQWQAAQTTTDLTSTIQAAVDYAHGKTGIVFFPQGMFRIDGTVYVQKDRTTSASGKIWKPILLQGAGHFKSNYAGNGGEGATILYKPNAGVMVAVNIESTTGANMSATDKGLGVTATGATMTHQFFNFNVADIAFKSDVGVQATAIKGYATRANLRRLSFINVWRGWDFIDSDTNGAQNYCDMWDVDDIYMTGIGNHMFRQSSADASVFKNIKCESFQSTAVGAFEMLGGRGFAITGLLVNGLATTSNYIGHLRGCSQAVIQAGHFEHNQCATIVTNPSTGQAYAWTAVVGFLVEGGRGNVIANNEWYNSDNFYGTPVPALTRPFVYLDGGVTPTAAGRHLVYGNTFRAARGSSYDVADTSYGSLVFGNLALNPDDTFRADSFYRQSSSDAYANYGSIFPHNPIIASDLPSPFSTSSNNPVTFTRNGSSSSYYEEAVKVQRNEDAGGVIDHGATLTFYSNNDSNTPTAAARIGSTWETTTAGSEKSGFAVYVKSSAADTSAATKAFQVKSTGDVVATYGNITIAGAGQGLNLTNSANTVTKKITLNSDGSGLAVGSTTLLPVTNIADNNEMYINTKNYNDSTNRTATRVGTGTYSGNVNYKVLSIEPVYNQASGGGSNYDLRVMRTETALGTGIQRLASFGLFSGGTYVEKWGVDNTGNMFLTPSTPASSTAACTQGQFKADANYVYVCTSTNVWKRSALSAF